MRREFTGVVFALAFGLCWVAGCATTRERDGLALTFAGAADGTDEELLFFELRNGTGEPIWFTGFDVNDPLYEIHRVEGETSMQVDTAMSATGAGPQALGSGQRTTFVVPRSFPEAGSFWFELGVSTVSSPRARTIRSDVFTLGPAVER